MLDKAAEWLKTIQPSEARIVYHGGCGDGLTSAAILSKFCQKWFGEIPKSIAGSPNNLQKLKISSKYVIIVDIAADAWEKWTLNLAQNSKILILDHHELLKNLNPFGILHVNPNIYSKDKLYYTGAKLVFDVCSKIYDVSDLDWLAAIGIVNDVAGEHWKDFLDSVFAKWSELGSASYGFESKIGFLASILNSAQDVKNGEKIALRLLQKAERPADILEGKSSEAKILLKIREARRAEMDYYVQNWKKIAILHTKEKLVWLYIKPKYRIASAVATILAQKNPDYLFIVLNEEDDRVKISFRQTKGLIDCNWLAQESTKLFGGAGGGHREAAGGTIKIIYLEQFKAKVLSLIKSKKI
ncbi:MAG: DHHA1 domain-containing protein [Candidatus Nanoarchaeia archaeon]